MDNEASRRPPLDKAFADYLEETDAGGETDREHLVSEHPELAGILESHDALERITAPLRELFASSREEAPAEPLEPGTIVGNHELLEVIGRDGQGIVYRARHIRFNHEVALKTLLSGVRAGEEDVRRFVTEVENQAELDHSNIVPVFGGGEHEGRLYFTMKLMERGSLANRAPGEAVHPRIAAEWMITIARAVHHAHQRGILHRDLKPANILLGSEGRPYVSDFGLSKRLEGEEPLEAEYMVGAPAFLPPEQIRGESTIASDVYGLGMILYWLLSGGRAPFWSDDLHDVLRRVKEEEPEPLHPSVDRRLAAICGKCLAKVPERRYSSAEELAVVLESWRDHRPLPDSGLLERFRLWCRRHPAAAAVTACGCTLLVSVILAVIWVAQVREERLREEALASNVYAARGIAGTVLRQLDRLSRPVADLASELRLREPLSRKDGFALRTVVESARRRHRDPLFESWYILDATGTLLAVAPETADVVSEDFSGRDYFRRAMRYGALGRRHIDAIHISRIYRSLNDGLSKLAISAPVYADPADPERGVLGVVVTTITTGPSLGLHHLRDARREAVLLARADTEPRRPGVRPDFEHDHVVLLHPTYSRGEDPVPFPGGGIPSVRRPGIPELRLAAPDQFFDPDDAYEDPVRGGRWLAGFAPVGNTELVVIVQQPYDEAIQPYLVLDRSLVLWTGIALSLGFLFAVAAARLAVKRAAESRRSR